MRASYRVCRTSGNMLGRISSHGYGDLRRALTYVLVIVNIRTRFNGDQQNCEVYQAKVVRTRVFGYQPKLHEKDSFVAWHEKTHRSQRDDKCIQQAAQNVYTHAEQYVAS